MIDKTIGDDFSVTTFTIEVPVNSHKVDIPPFYNITDDDINEREQSFVLVAEIVPYSATNVSCFWTQVAKKECLGMISITEIRIVDNDRKYKSGIIAFV